MVESQDLLDGSVTRSHGLRHGYALVLDRRGQPIHGFHDPSGRYFALNAALPRRQRLHVYA